MFESAALTLTLRERLKQRLQAKARGRFVSALGCFLLGTALFLATIAFFIRSISGPGDYDLAFEILVLGFMSSWLFVLAAHYLTRSWLTQNERLTVEEAVERDRRPPVLYLRPFKSDSVRFKTFRSRTRWIRMIVELSILGWIGVYFRIGRNLWLGESRRSRRPRGEELLVSLFEPLGPVIAIGRPGEWFPPLGAARLYVKPNESWQDVVHGLVERSQLIVFFAGMSPGFVWDLGKVFRNEPFVPTIMVLPFFRRYRQSRATRFVAMFEEATGLRLPSDLSDSRAIYFPDRYSFVVARDQKTEWERAANGLNPFLGAVGQIMDLRRPGWSDGFRLMVLDDQKANRRWLWIGGPLVTLVLLNIFVWGPYRQNKERNAEEQYLRDRRDGIFPCTDPIVLDAPLADRMCPGYSADK